jgi:hypothetical protein
MIKIVIVFSLLYSTLDAGSLNLFTKVGKFLKTTNKKPINYALKGKKHPKTGVKYNDNGYPIFKSNYTCDMRLSWFEREFDKLRNNSSTRSKHFRICSKQLYKQLLKKKKLKEKFTKKQLKQLRSGKTPDNYTWHHEPKTDILTLVDRDIHAKTSHSGGFSLNH